MKITVKRSQNEEEPWYFLLTADNGEVLSTSETYHNKNDAVATAQLIAEDQVVIEVEE